MQEDGSDAIPGLSESGMSALCIMEEFVIVERQAVEPHFHQVPLPSVCKAETCCPMYFCTMQTLQKKNMVMFFTLCKKTLGSEGSEQGYIRDSFRKISKGGQKHVRRHLGGRAYSG